MHVHIPITLLFSCQLFGKAICNIFSHINYLYCISMFNSENGYLTKDVSPNILQFCSMSSALSSCQSQNLF